MQRSFIQKGDESPKKMFEGLYLYKLWEHISQAGEECKETYENPVVENCCMLGHESVNPELVTTQWLHDLKMMQFIPLLCKMYLYCHYFWNMPSKSHDGKTWSNKRIDAVNLWSMQDGILIWF